MNHCGGRCNVIWFSFSFSDFSAQGCPILLPQLTNRKFGTFRFIILMNGKKALISHFCELLLKISVWFLIWKHCGWSNNSKHRNVDVSVVFKRTPHPPLLCCMMCTSLGRCDWSPTSLNIFITNSNKLVTGLEKSDRLSKICWSRAQFSRVNYQKVARNTRRL